jgi:hypothetical protein
MNIIRFIKEFTFNDDEDFLELRRVGFTFNENVLCCEDRVFKPKILLDFVGRYGEFSSFSLILFATGYKIRPCCK